MSVKGFIYLFFKEAHYTSEKYAISLITFYLN